MKKATRKASKNLIILARIKWNHEDKVCYLVRASKPLIDGQYTLLKAKGLVSFEGEEYQSVVRHNERYLVYQVCFVAGEIAGCNCPAHDICYHKKQLIEIEGKRRQSVAAPAAAIVAVEQVVVTTTTTTEATAEVSDDELNEILAEIEAEHKAEHKKAQPQVDLGECGSFHSNKPFSLLKR